ncbi:histidine kinase [Bifidobacterium ramosum]|uniref:Sensor-like histidine kinase SenX3 n=1 Tax=Bifidobacterium ramosum TaxID=1798158 RepID=A0A6L4WZT8_9BIFI|nr:ATP-binding protein [Bifidobacterium ramosum]KAB8286657.1 histidine kinase [Bifidobacterium ramosum]NEG71722.1 two-component sensor histidine kinase [Bifidobacterium ramosum]
MTWWQIVLIMVLAAAVVAVAYALGRTFGRQQGERQVEAILHDTDRQSLFGEDVPVRAAERGLIEVAPEAVFVCDGRGHVRYASPGARTFSLMDNGRLNSADIADILSLVVADGQTREREVHLPADRTRRNGVQLGRGVQPGQEVPSDTLYLRVRIGRVVDGLYAVFLVDMSERRRFEAMRRDFVTNVSHELKTPAGAISLLAETITDAADDPDAVRYFSGRVAKESNRLTELVHRLIDLQKAQSMEGVVAMRPVSVMDVVRAAIGENQVQADAKSIDLRLTLRGVAVPTVVSDATNTTDTTAVATDATDATTNASSDASAADVTVMADAESLKTAVKNLVENAIHYSPAHTVVAIGVDDRDGKVTIRVVDQGIGIPAESLGRIFERFYRVDPARSRETGGSGLGLAITKHCVQECGGTIAVWSREGEGSTFTIELPVAERRKPDDSGHAAA